MEVELTRVEPTEIVTSELLVREAGEDTRAHRRSVPVRFVDPRPTGLSEDEIATLLGEEAVCGLRSYGGLDGEYTVERHFGIDGRRQLEAVGAHNERAAAELSAEVSEWGP